MTEKTIDAPESHTPDDRENPPSETVALWLASIPRLSAESLVSFVERNGRFWRFTPELEAAIAARQRQLAL